MNYSVLIKHITKSGALFIGLLASISALTGQTDADFFIIGKFQLYDQANPGDQPSAQPSEYYSDVFLLPGDTGTVKGGTLFAPGDLTGMPLIPEDGAFYLEQDFDNETDLDTGVPDGSYTIKIDTGGAQTTDITLDLETPVGGYKYPPVPRIASIEELTVSDVDVLRITWDPWATPDPGTDDIIHIFLETDHDDIWQSPVLPSEGTPIAPAATSIDIPKSEIEANIAGRTFGVCISFIHVVDLDETTPGVNLAVAAFGSETCVEYTADGTATGPWTTELRFAFNFNEGTFQEIDGIYTGVIGDSPGFQYWIDFTAYGDDVDPQPSANTVTFTGPTDSGLEHGPSATWANAWDDGGAFNYTSISVDISPGNYPPTGTYSVNYGGTDYTFDSVPDPTAELRHVIMVPSIEVLDGIIDHVSWTYADTAGDAGDSNLVQTYASRINIWIGDDQGELYNEWDISPFTTGVNLFSHGISWNNVTNINLTLNDNQENSFNSNFTNPGGISRPYIYVNFNHQNGSLGEPASGMLTGSLSFPLEDNYSLNFNIQDDSYPLANEVLFTGPSGSPFSATPADNFNSWDNWGNYQSPGVDISTNGSPPSGDYTIRYKGADQVYGLMVIADYQAALVPVFQFDGSNNITSISWSFFDRLGNTVSDTSFVSWIDFSLFDANGNFLYSSGSLSGAQTTDTSVAGQSIPWSNVNSINFMYGDQTGNNYGSVFFHDTTPGTDIVKFWLNKDHAFEQTDASTVVAYTGVGAWEFFAYAMAADVSRVNAVNFDFNGNPGGFFGLGQDGVNYSFVDEQSDKNGWNNYLPDATYTFSFDTVNDGQVNVPLDFTGDAFPSTNPLFSNYNETQNIDPTQPFLLAWNTFTDSGQGTNVDFAFVEFFIVLDGVVVYESGPLDPTTTSHEIPADTLSPNSNYSIQLFFINSVDENTTDYPGVIGAASYSTSTSVSVMTASGSTTEPSFAAVLKEGYWRQTGPDTVVLQDYDWQDPFVFFAEVEGTGITGASVILPDGTTWKSLWPEDDGWNYSETFSAAGTEPYDAFLNDVIPDGIFTFDIVLSQQTFIQETVTLSGDLPPAPILQNFENLDQWQADESGIIQWAEWTGNTEGDYIIVDIEDPWTGNTVWSSPDVFDDGALTGDTTSVNIPADTFMPGMWYEGEISFISIRDFKETQSGTWAAVKVSNTVFNFFAGLDVRSVWVNKDHGYKQTGPDSEDISEFPGGPWEFAAQIHLAYPGAVTAATLEHSGNPGVQVPMQGDEGEFFIEDDQMSEASLNSIYPDNQTYTLSMTTATEGTKTVALDLTGPNYPTTIPRLLNYDEAQMINPDSDFMLSWNAFDESPGGAVDYSSIHLSIYEPIGEDDEENVYFAGPLDPSTTHHYLPREILEPGKTYFLELFFNHFVDDNTTDYPGVIATANYSNSTEVELITIADNQVVVGVVFKGVQYRQRGPDHMELRDDEDHKAFEFESFVEGSGISGGSVVLPNGTTVKTFEKDEDETEWRYYKKFHMTGSDPQDADLQVEFPDGSYTITADFDSGGSDSGTVDLQGDYSIPPKVTGWENFLGWPSDQDLNLTWNQWKPNPENDFIMVEVWDHETGDNIYSSPDPYSTGALTADMVSITIPAAQLEPGRRYQVSIEFLDIVDEEPSTGGGLWVAAYGTRTRTNIWTAIDYDTWAAERIETEGLRHPWFDPDGDFLPNVVEYLTGSDPNWPNMLDPIEVRIENDHFVHSVTGLIGADQNYLRWQQSSDLGTWNPIIPVDLRLVDYWGLQGRLEFWFAMNPVPDKTFFRMEIGPQVAVPVD